MISWQQLLIPNFARFNWNETKPTSGFFTILAEILNLSLKDLSIWVLVEILVVGAKLFFLSYLQDTG